VYRARKPFHPRRLYEGLLKKAFLTRVTQVGGIGFMSFVQGKGKGARGGDDQRISSLFMAICI
jgi:hypothetical protein